MSIDRSHPEARRQPMHRARRAALPRQQRRRENPHLAFIPILLLAPAGIAATTCPYSGGWALRTSLAACPPSAPIDCGRGIQGRCCPSGFVCAGDGAYQGNYCCVDGQDCRAQASSNPECPSPSWTLWGVGGKIDQGAWCCLPGLVGAYQNDTSLGSNFGVACFASTATLASDLGQATKVATTACTPSSSSAPTTTAPSSTTTNTPPPTSADSGAGGGGGGQLSAGGIAGAVVGSIAGLAMLGALGMFLLRKRRSSAGAGQAEEAWKHEEAPTPGMAPGQVLELPDTERHEMEGPAPSARHELPS